MCWNSLASDPERALCWYGSRSLNPSTPAHVLERLASDPSYTVRAGSLVAGEPDHTPTPRESKASAEGSREYVTCDRDVAEHKSASDAAHNANTAHLKGAEARRNDAMPLKERSVTGSPAT